VAPIAWVCFARDTPSRVEVDAAPGGTFPRKCCESKQLASVCCWHLL
jgi:hypothetical protein